VDLYERKLIKMLAVICYD